MSDLTIKQFPRGKKFTEDGVLSARAREIIQSLVELDILSGTGSPEGVMSAKPKRQYMDTNGTPGNILYIKRDADISGDTSKGWVLI
jgi:hypothetical protein